MFLTACSSNSSNESNTSDDMSHIGEDYPTSSEVKDFIENLEEWENSSNITSGTDSETSSDRDDTTSTTTSTTMPGDNNSYENGGNWTQGWH